MLFYILDFILYLHAISQIIHFLSPTTYVRYMNIINTYFQNTVIVIGFNCIYLYSRGQLFLIKLMIEVNAFVDYFNINGVLDIWNGGEGLTDEKIKFISFVKNGHVESNYFLDSIYEKEALINKNMNYDLLAFCTFDKPNYIVLYKSIPDNLEYRPLNFKFIYVEVELENSSPFKIDLCNEYYNFYVVNNTIDPEFVLYILKIHYLSNISYLSDETLLNYKINIIDQDATMISLDSNKTLTFHEDNYIITEKVNPFAILLEAQNRKITDNMTFSKEENIEEEKEEEYVEVDK